MAGFILIISIVSLICSENTAWRSSGSAHEELINNLCKNGFITSESVKDTMLSVDRGLFSFINAYEDWAQPIGYGATISAPRIHAYALEILKDHLQPGSHALDVGSGSGYLTVCMALMVGSKGVAVGVEHIDELTKFALGNVEKWMKDSEAAKSHDIKLGEQLKLVTGDGRQGWQEDAPYNAIHVGASSPTIPDALKQQLKVGGRLICPEGPPGEVQVLVQIDRLANGSFQRTELKDVIFVPLTDKDLQLRPRYKFRESSQQYQGVPNYVKAILIVLCIALCSVGIYMWLAMYSIL
ncbi:unnamed protein product [Trichobilharzia szidati]|nr:unnamed protein product [Trichobilharzia szidati]